MQPLDGAMLKIVRAQKHLDCLRNEIRGYLETDPYKFPLQISTRTITAGLAHSSFEPPLELGCIFGDCINNLRSSLDYIAWELATKYTPSAMLAKEGKSVYFPISKSPLDFTTKRGAKLTN